MSTYPSPNPAVAVGRILQALVSLGVHVPDEEEAVRQVARSVGSVTESDITYLRDILSAAQRERRNAAVRQETIARACRGDVDIPPRRRHLSLVPGTAGHSIEVRAS